MTLRVYVFLAVLYEHITFWKILEWEIWEAYSVVSWVCRVGIRAVSTSIPSPVPSLGELGPLILSGKERQQLIVTGRVSFLEEVTFVVD